MTSKDILTILGAACVTAALSLAVLQPPLLQATGGADAPEIERPRLVAGGVEVTLTADRVFGAGEEPSFRLTATNTTASPAAVTIETAMTSWSSPAQPRPDAAGFRPVARMLPRAQTLWTQQLPLVLDPHETTTTTLFTKTPLPAGSIVNVVLQEAGGAGLDRLSVSALSFSTSPSAAIGGR